MTTQSRTSLPFNFDWRSISERINNPNYYWITRPLMAFFITRLIVFVGAYLAEIAIPGVIGDGYYHVNPNNVLLDVWARWDSSFYINIVERGYWFEVGQQSAVAFFPLYPLLMSLLKPIVGSTLAAGVLVSNLCLLGALIFLYRLTEHEFKNSATATRAVFYIAAFPTSFFFTAVYTESLFLLTSIGAVYFARKRIWVWAVLFGLLCSSTRIVGVLMWGVVGLEWLKSHGWTFSTIHKIDSWKNMLKGLRTDYLNLAVIFIIPLGLISYMIFLNARFGDPVAFSTTQSAWGREMVGPIAIIIQDIRALGNTNLLSGEIWYHIIFDLGAFFTVLFMAVTIWRRLGESYAIYSVLSVLIPASSGSQSLIRYILVIFPVFMLLAHWGRNTYLDRILMIGFSVFLGIFTTIFVNWIFIA